MSKVHDFLDEAGVFFLATADGDQPKLRPLGFHMEMEGKEMFGVGDFKDVYKQLVANPKVEIVAAKPDGHWMRYTGKAVFDTDPKYEAAGLEAMPNLKEMAARKPETITQLRQVEGFGEEKIRRWGADFIAIIKKYNK